MRKLNAGNVFMSSFSSENKVMPLTSDSQMQHNKTKQNKETEKEKEEKNRFSSTGEFWFTFTGEWWRRRGGVRRRASRTKHALVKSKTCPGSLFHVPVAYPKEKKGQELPCLSQADILSIQGDRVWSLDNCNHNTFSSPDSSQKKKGKKMKRKKKKPKNYVRCSAGKWMKRPDFHNNV